MKTKKIANYCVLISFILISICCSLLLSCSNLGAFNSKNSIGQGAVVTKGEGSDPKVIIRSKKIKLPYSQMQALVDKYGSLTTPTEEEAITGKAIAECFTHTNIPAQYKDSSAFAAGATVEITLEKGYKRNSIRKEFILENSDGTESVDVPSLALAQLRGKILDEIDSCFGSIAVPKSEIEKILNSTLLFDELPQTVPLSGLAELFIFTGQMDKVRLLCTQYGKTLNFVEVSEQTQRIDKMYENNAAAKSQSIADRTLEIYGSMKKSISSVLRSDESATCYGFWDRGVYGTVPDGAILLKANFDAIRISTLLLDFFVGENSGVIKLGDDIRCQYWTHDGLFSLDAYSKYGIQKFAEDNTTVINGVSNDGDHSVVTAVGTMANYLTMRWDGKAKLQGVNSFHEADDMSILQPKGWSKELGSGACEAANDIFRCNTVTIDPDTKEKSFDGGVEYDMPVREAISEIGIGPLTFPVSFGNTSHNLKSDHAYCSKVIYTGYKRNKRGSQIDVEAHDGPGNLIGPDSVYNGSIDQGYWVKIVVCPPSYMELPAGVKTTSSQFVYTHQATTDVIYTGTHGWLPRNVLYDDGGSDCGVVPIDRSNYGSGAVVTVLDNAGQEDNPTPLTKNWHTFAGWRDGYGNMYNPGDQFTMPDHSVGSTNVTLYAIWKKNPVYTVTYNANGADSGNEPTDYFQYQTGSTVTVQGNTKSLTKAGYSFIGWCVNPNGTGASYSKGQYLAIKSDNVTLYARWSAQPAYSVSYNANGADAGSVPSDGTLYEAGALVTVDGNAGGLSKSGYTFAGWCVSASGVGTSYIGGKTFRIGSSSVVLYAKWEDTATAAPSYTVTYSDLGAAAAGADGTSITPAIPVDPNSYHTGDPVTVYGNVGNALNPGNLVKNGYSFKGWSLNQDGSGSTWNAGDRFLMGSSNLTLYSAWTLIPTYTVTYSLDGTPAATGGNAPVDSKAYKYNDTVTVLAPVQVPTLYGYTFHGWSPYANGLSPVYSPGQTFTMGSDNVTLYVAWTKDPTYRVTYDANGATGGSVPDDGSNYLSGQTVTVLANTGDLKKSIAGDTTIYSFAGWNTSALGDGTSYGASGSATFTMGSSDVTLYALWSSTPTYGVNYDANADGDTTLTGSVPLDLSTYKTGQTVTVSANTGNLSRTGYYFRGWSLSNSNNVSSTVSSFTMGASPMTLYGVWQKKRKFTISYDLNGGTSGTAPEAGTVYEDETYKIARPYGVVKNTIIGEKYLTNESNVKMLLGFVPCGWSTSSDGKTGDFYSIYQSVIVSSDMTLYAQYSPIGLSFKDENTNDTDYGTIFYARQTGVDTWDFIESAKSDVVSGPWSNQSGSIVTDTSVWTGYSNTQKIVAVNRSYINFAAKAARDSGGSWCLPSRDELNLMYINLYNNGFDTNFSGSYWSSSQADTENAWSQSFDSSGTQTGVSKGLSLKVRPVRYFHGQNY